MLSRKKVIAFKLEGTEGTAEAVTVADAGILATNIKWSPNLKVTKRKIMLNTLTSKGHTPHNVAIDLHLGLYSFNYLCRTSP